MTRCALPLLPLALLGLALPAFSAGPPPAAATRPPRPKVEVVFCLDTTGSMGHLIQGAKDKIWSMCNQIAGGQPVPDLRVGLVAYRDKGDEYVTRVHDLTDDLDDIHARLKKFEAKAGGDTPEHVNQALHDAVHKVKWSADKRVLKIIFLVGDAPPHMDYNDDVKYPVTCQEAVKKGIIINTIQCGSLASCTTAWKDIAAKAEGVYAAIPQRGGVVTVKTPYDAKLGKINSELAETTLVYGSKTEQAAGEGKLAEAKALPGGAAADRASFAGKSGRVASYDLIDAIADKKVKLSDLKEAELPPALQKLKTARSREEYIEKVRKRRVELNKEARDLGDKRAAHIEKELKKGKAQDSFDGQVLRMLQGQAKKHGIKY